MRRMAIRQARQVRVALRAVQHEKNGQRSGGGHSGKTGELSEEIARLGDILPRHERNAL